MSLRWLNSDSPCQNAVNDFLPSRLSAAGCQAIKQSVDGDTIQLLSGVYEENLVIEVI